MLLEATDSQLALIDYQPRLMAALFEGDAALANAVRLAKLARLLGVPVWATEQCPAKLGGSAPELAGLLDRAVPKTAFGGASELAPLLNPPRPPQPAARGGNARSLPRHLQKPAEPPAPQRSSIVIAGCEAHVCLLQTALALLDEEWDVWVVTDACASRTERNRDAAYDRLAAAGAELATTEMVGFEWLRSAEHPHFRDWRALIK